MAADVYLRVPEYSKDAARYKFRALRAWNWAEANPDVIFKNNDAKYNSEGYMFKITGEKKYARQVETLYGELNPITPWAADGFEGDIAPTLLYFSRMGGVSQYQNIMTGDNGVMRGVERAEHAYTAPMNSYNWGSNSTASRRGSVFTQAAQSNMTGASETDFKNAGAGYLHYLHGVNPQGSTMVGRSIAGR